jgi:hypothetical protein
LFGLAVLAALSRVLLTGLPLATTLLPALSGLLAWFRLATLLLAALTGLRLLTTLVLIAHEYLLL